MRNIQLRFFGLAALGLAVFVCTRPWVASPEPKTASPKSAQSSHFKGILLAGRKIQNISSAPATPACKDLWAQVRELDLQKMNEDVFRGCLILPKTGDCTKPPSALALSHASYEEACSLFTDPDYSKHSEPGLDEKAQTCFLALVAYRSAIGSWLTKDQPVSQMSDVQALGDRLLNEMFRSLQGDGASVADVRAIANRVNELDGNVYSTSKIAAVADVMDALSAPSTENWRKAQHSFENLERFQSDDPEIEQLGLWVRTEGFKPDRLREEANRMVEDSPQSGLGYFYLAFAEAGAGNREKVGALFMSAVQAEPNNPTFVRALENFRARRPVPPPFKFDFDFRIAELVERG